MFATRARARSRSRSLPGHFATASVNTTYCNLVYPAHSYFSTHHPLSAPPHHSTTTAYLPPLLLPLPPPPPPPPDYFTPCLNSH